MCKFRVVFPLLSSGRVGPLYGGSPSLQGRGVEGIFSVWMIAVGRKERKRKEEVGERGP